MELLSKYTSMYNVEENYKLFKSKKIVFAISDLAAYDMFISCLDSIGYCQADGKALIQGYFINGIHFEENEEGYMIFFYHKDSEYPYVKYCGKDHDCHSCLLFPKCIGGEPDNVVILDYNSVKELKYLAEKGAIE